MSYGTLGIDTIQSSTTGTPTQFQDGSGAQIGTLCRAWVNFVGATGVRNGSFNVSSVTRNGAGDYTVNFATALSDANYSAVVSCTQRGGASVPTANYSIGYGSASTANANGTYSTSSIEFYAQGSTGTGIDPNIVSVSVFR